MVNVSEDKSSLLMKEIELKEKESKLLTRVRELELRQRDASNYTSKEVEANLEERFHTELRQKESEWKFKEQQLLSRIQDMEKDMLRLSMDLKLKDDKLKISEPGQAGHRKGRLPEIRGADGQGERDGHHAERTGPDEAGQSAGGGVEVGVAGSTRRGIIGFADRGPAMVQAPANFLGLADLGITLVGEAVVGKLGVTRTLRGKL